MANPVGSLVKWGECSPKIRKTGVQSQVESYQTQKMVLDATLLDIQDYKIRIKDKVEQSKERSNAFPLHVAKFTLSLSLSLSIYIYIYI